MDCGTAEGVIISHCWTMAIDQISFPLYDLMNFSGAIVPTEFYSF
jgi:hypothetical protein